MSKAIMLTCALLPCLFLVGASPTTRPAADLGGEQRFLTHLSTDKPIYRAGEKVYIRGVMLHAADHTPNGETVQAQIEIKGPKGDTVANGASNLQDSVLGYAWEIPSGQAGGEYTVKVSYPRHGYTPAERKFDIRAYRAPRLKSQIVFLRDGYGPGDSVSATAHVDRAEGGFPANARVTAIARVDGGEAWRGQSSIDAAGNCSVSFKLPAQIERGEGSLALVIEDGGTVETASKTIPILLQTVDLELYPEGGDLVAGLTNRVYLEAKTPAKKPADIAGTIIDATGATLATFRTAHEGRGRFEFKPAKDTTYALKITEPAGIKKLYVLPVVKDRGVVLSSSQEVTEKNQPVKLKLAAIGSGTYKLTLSKHEVEVASQSVKISSAEPVEVALAIPASADGVLVATVCDEKGLPLAERLVYRQPARSINVQVSADSSTYTPADRVSLSITTTDDANQPVSAVVGLTVTDDAVLEMIEKREQAPRLPVMVLLEDDVKELADAQVYLDKSNPKAPLACDLLLGTQGWRRFAFRDTGKFIAQYEDAARRVVAYRVPDAVRREMDLARERRMGGMGGGIGRGGAAVNRLPLAAAPPAPLAQDKALADARPALVAAEDRAAKGAADAPAARRGGGRGGRGAAAARVAPFVVVREYAHAVRPNRLDNDRVDFAETLFWHAGIRTSETTGQASVSFALSDAVTSFRVFADGFDKTGALGSSSSTTIQSIQPFFIEPKLPLEVTTGDTIQLPIAMVNGMARDLYQVKINARPTPALAFANPTDDFTLASHERTRRLLRLDVASGMGNVNFDLTVNAGPFFDHFLKPLSVQPLGFPIEVAKGGLIDFSAPASLAVAIPDSAVKDSVRTSVTVFPTPLANLTAALERLIREPNGCFEQTSSTSYPLVMAQQYFLTHTGVEAKLIEQARVNLDKAYTKLAGFECKQKGYEWFGGDPGHEALTAYGLMQFVDMTQIRGVDPAMLERTRQWLLARRDGKGNFQRNQRALDSFGGAPQLTTDAYITWALLESGQKGLETEVAAVKQGAAASQDSYVLALTANILFLSGDKDGAKSFMEKLTKKQADTGAVDGAVTSITRSGGEALAIETTALSMLAWMREPSFAPNVEKGIKFLADSCKSGRFGSTQSTILALRAIVNYDKSRARPKAPGTLTLLVDGKPVGNIQAFDVNTQGAIAMPEFSELMTPGKHSVDLKMADGSSMPFAMTVRYFSTQPPNSPRCKLDLSVSLRNPIIDEGAITEAAVTVTNKTDELLPTPLAIIGLPGGLEVRHDQLKELVKAGTIDAYEVIGREVVLYWRALKPGAKVSLPISAVAAIPGKYTAPASRAYLYYTDEDKIWAPGVKVSITPKQ